MKSLKLHKEFGVNPTIPLCFCCGKEKGEIVLLGSAFKGEAPMMMTIDKEPCDECKKKFEDGFVCLIEVKDGEKGDNPYRTGRMIFVKKKALTNFYDGYIAFVEESLMNQLFNNQKGGNKDGN